jgi:soluble lytic murein transglycosylase-like protein
MTPELMERIRVMTRITAEKESGNRDRNEQGRVITSSKGAQGRMQVMPGTARNPGYGQKPAGKGDEALAESGNNYLSAMMRRYDGDPAKAWAAYNCGPGCVNRHIAKYGENWRRELPSETKNYLDWTLPRLEAAEAETARARAQETQRSPPLDPRWLAIRKRPMNP